MKRLFGLIAVSLTSVIFAGHARAENLITDGTFQLGPTLSPWWGVTPDTNTSDTPTPSNDGALTKADGYDGIYVDSNGNYAGNYASLTGSDQNHPGAIGQDVATVPGQQYLLSYWYLQEGAYSYFNLYWDGNKIGGLQFGSPGDYTFGNGNVPWTDEEVMVTGTGNDSVAFQGYDDPSWINLADIELTPVMPVPEPSSFALLIGTGATCTVAYAWRRRKKPAA